MEEQAGPRSEPLTPEEEARLRPEAKRFKAGSGHPTTRYVEVARHVHETREGRKHIERDFPYASPEHVAGNLRRQSHKHGFDVAVALNPADGVSAMYVGWDEDEPQSETSVEPGGDSPTVAAEDE